MNEEKIIKEISFEINNDILELYNSFYFEKYTKRKKHPIKSPIPLSLNQWMVMIRNQANDKKKKWLEFGRFVVEYYGFSNLNINKCSLEILYYFPTKRKCDLDNYSGKFVLDSFCSAGLLTDDNYNVINPLVLRGEYRKGDPGSKFTFFIESYGEDDEEV